MSQAPDLSERLRKLNATIQELMSIAGTAGLSIGVYRNGQCPYYANLGFRDVERKLEPSKQTIYPICSLTKMFTAMALALLVDDPDTPVAWDTPVIDLLPELAIEDEGLRERMTVTDILAHRTGMSVPHVRLGSENNILIAHEDSMKFINDQVPAFPFRERWYYNNTGYEIAGLILDKFRGSWAQVFREEFFEPSGMRRTFCRRPPGETCNVSKAYNTLDDGSPCEIPTVKAGEGSFGGASGGMFSCVEDLLKAYTCVIKSTRGQSQPGLVDTAGFRVRDPDHLFSDKIHMRDAAGGITSASYTCGLARVTLPEAMGYVGTNPDLMPDGKMPTVAKGISPTTVLWHQGSLPGALSAVAMMPEIDTAVVVLSNSLALNDCADWVVQLLLEEILECPNRNDYIAFAKLSVSRTLEWYPRTASRLKHKPGDGPSLPLSAYVGTYWNRKRYLKIIVTLSNKRLIWSLQGLKSERFELEHYKDDTFIWLRRRDYLVARGRWVDQPPVYWKLKFHGDGKGRVASLNWVHEPNVPTGEDFFKDSIATLT